LMSAIAAVLWSASRRAKNISFVLVALLLLGIWMNLSGRIADITWAKGIRRQNVEFAKWNAISRVEVDRAPDGARVIVIDADANTFIMNADPRHFGATDWQRQLMSAPPALVNILRPHGS